MTTDDGQTAFDFESGALDKPETVTAKLDDVGLETSGTHDPETAVEQSSEFGIDDTDLEDTDATEQQQLFPDVEDNQLTLGGEKASQQCLFGEG